MSSNAGHAARRAALVGAAALCILVGSSSPAVAQPPPSIPSGPSNEQSTSLGRAMQSSMRLLMVEHLFRIAFQEKTRSELGGPFFKDYRRSVRMPRQWSDGDGRFTNYFLHPLQGAATGYIWLDTHPEGIQSLSNDGDYWRSRLRAIAWATVYSLQWEVGPLSEASIGNVGKNSEHVGWVDHVITPTGGFMMMLGEDAVDRFLLSKLEARTNSPVLRAILRTALTPSRASANLSAMRPPWHRPERPLR